MLFELTLVPLSALIAEFRSLAVVICGATGVVTGGVAVLEPLEVEAVVVDGAVDELLCTT